MSLNLTTMMSKKRKKVKFLLHYLVVGQVMMSITKMICKKLCKSEFYTKLFLEHNLRPVTFQVLQMNHHFQFQKRAGRLHLYHQYQWTDELGPVYVNDFDQPTGVTVPVPDTVRGVFQLIFDKQMVDHIVRETNRYAKSVMESFWSDDNDGSC